MEIKCTNCKETKYKVTTIKNKIRFKCEICARETEMMIDNDKHMAICKTISTGWEVKKRDIWKD